MGWISTDRGKLTVKFFFHMLLCSMISKTREVELLTIIDLKH